MLSERLRRGLAALVGSDVLPGLESFFEPRTGTFPSARARDPCSRAASTGSTCCRARRAPSARRYCRGCRTRLGPRALGSPAAPASRSRCPWFAPCSVKARAGVQRTPDYRNPQASAVSAVTNRGLRPRRAPPRAARPSPPRRRSRRTRGRRPFQSVTTQPAASRIGINGTMSYGLELTFDDEVDESRREHRVVVAVAAEAVQKATLARAPRTPPRTRRKTSQGASPRALRPRASCTPGT